MIYTAINQRISNILKNVFLFSLREFTYLQYGALALTALTIQTVLSLNHDRVWQFELRFENNGIYIRKFIQTKYSPKCRKIFKCMWQRFWWKKKWKLFVENTFLPAKWL